MERSNKLVIAVTVLCLAGLGYVTVERAALKEVKRTDFTVYMTAANAVLRGGEDLYTTINDRGWHYTMPPLFAILMVPLALLSPVTAVAVWYVITIGVLVLGVRLILRLVSVRGQKHPQFIIGLPLFICASPLLETISRGQLGILMLTLCVAALCCYREGKPFLAGVLVAFATTLKVYSALLVLYFVYRKEWRALIACAIGFLGFALVIPSAVFGLELTVGLSVYWFSHVVLPFAKPYGESLPFPELQSHTLAKNQSLYGTFSRIADMLQGGALGSGFSWIKAAVAVGCLALLVLLFLGWRGKKESLGPHRLLFEWSISMMFGLLIIPTAWSHYFSLLVFPLASSISYFHDGASDGDRRLLRRSLIAVAVLSGVYTLASLLYPLVGDTSLGLGRTIIMVARSIGLYCWATLILGGTLIYLLASPTSAEIGRLSSEVSRVQGG